MVGFDATPVELQVCGSMLSQIKDEVDNQVRVLRGEVEALIGGGWQGTAAEGFAAGWEQWHAGAMQVLAALDTMGRLLGRTGQNYDVVEQDSTSMMWWTGEGL
jgi:WXG100 family type VII secretion target